MTEKNQSTVVAQGALETDEVEREKLITDLRREKLGLHDALKNMMGIYDTPLSRRRFPPDEFMKDALQSGRDALASQPAPAATVETDAVEGDLDAIVQLIHKHVGIKQRINVDLTGVNDAAKAILSTLRPRSSAGIEGEK